MDLRSLQYFVSVYEKQSFSAAAKACFVAQPSISSAVAQLEENLQTRLFIRHARGIKPTQRGETLYPLAKQLLGQADAIKHVFIEQKKQQAFNLGVTKGLGVERMSALLRDFTAAQPNMELTLVHQSDVCDARIIIKEELRDEEHYVSLWQEQFLLALPHNHVLSLKDSVNITELDNLPFIVRTPCSAWRDVSEMLALSGIKVDTRAKIQTIDYALGLVRAGLGCAFVPAHPEVLAKPDVSFRAISGLELLREIVLAYSKSTDLVDCLRELVVKHRQ